MTQKYKIQKGIPYPLGATADTDGINFATVLHPKSECGLILYAHDKKRGEIRIPFEKEHFLGNICCMKISGLNPADFDYNFYEDDRIITDPYAKKIVGNERWGIPKDRQPKTLCAGIVQENFCWTEDVSLRIPYEDSVFYCMHVRGFTMAPRSGVHKKGTFVGVMEKIPYLKQLGIRNVELMPVYEFEEAVYEKKEHSMQYAVEHYRDEPDTEAEEAGSFRLNYWGYQNAYYFAPKSSYAAGRDAAAELKELILKLHRNGIEAVCQFYFPKECSQGYILEVLKYWVLEYHIDGVHLMGTELPITLIATEPLFSNTKLIYYDFPYDTIYPDRQTPVYRNLASANDTFLTDCRKYLKSDEDMLSRVSMHFVGNSSKHGILRYITNYYGLTLADLVAYDRKHNEENGEDNRDGNDYNYSWNCGIEGKTRRTAVLKLREKQMKNAMSMVVLSLGTPFLMSGDEDCNTQQGNNNPYCQDNEIGWKDWNSSKTSAAMTAFLKQLLALRAQHEVFRKNQSCTFMDTLSCGYPDVSFHSEEAYRAQMENFSRHFGIMYSGTYTTSTEPDADFYIAYNMHWNEHSFALPKLKNHKKWCLIMDTELEDSFAVHKLVVENKTIAQGRSIQVLMSVEDK